MRFLIIALLASCGMTQRPVDILGKGTMCRPLSETQQECRDRNNTPFYCVDEGGRWKCIHMVD